MKRLDVLRDLRYVSSNFVSGKLRESRGFVVRKGM